MMDISDFLIFNNIIQLLRYLFKSLRINIIHMNLIPWPTNMLKPLHGVLLNHEYNLCQILLCYLFQSLVKSILLCQWNLLNLILLLWLIIFYWFWLLLLCLNMKRRRPFIHYLLWVWWLLLLHTTHRLNRLSWRLSLIATWLYWVNS